MNQPACARRQSARLRATGVALAAATIAHSPMPVLAQRYSMTVLPVPEGYVSAAPASLGGNGDICGYAVGSNMYGPVVWRGSRVIVLPTLEQERNRGYAHGINGQGVIVGQDFTSPLYPQQAVMWPDESTVVPILDRDSLATGINDNLIVVGEYTTGIFRTQPFMWKDGEWWSLGSMPFSGAVNNLNQAVVRSNWQAWLWDRGVLHELPPLNPGDRRIYGGEINERGEIAGSTEGADGLSRAVLWTNLVPRELAMPPDNLGAGIIWVNCDGIALGGYETSPNQFEATLHHHNLTTAVADLLMVPCAHDLRMSPWGINDDRQIAVTVQYSMQSGYRAARLEPLDMGLTVWSMKPSRPGRRNVIEVNHGTPGGRVSLLWGTQRGQPHPWPQCEGAEIDIVDPRIAGTAVAGPDGRAEFNLFIPADALGLHVLQAVDHLTCEVSPPAWALLKVEN